ncbi:putative inactive serine/threonine-protein kinase scy1-like [Capsicum annuum]|nr:putative inactive serine/threonine-protein kinase scy1-like [Capsicum annuum]
MFIQVAPSPSSVAAANANLGTNQVPAVQPTASFGSGTCAGASSKCQDDHVSMIACVFPAQKDFILISSFGSGVLLFRSFWYLEVSGHEESFLFVHNTGENTLMLKVNVSSANKTSENIQIPRHGVKQIIIPSKLGVSSSITLDAGTGKCTIDIGRSIWQGYFNMPSYTMYVTPTYGVYLLGTTALLIGGIIVCCKLRKQDRHVDGVAYQELELGQPKPHSSTKLEISAEGWNESWDDDWDDEKEVKSPGGKTIS